MFMDSIGSITKSIFGMLILYTKWGNYKDTYERRFDSILLS